MQAEQAVMLPHWGAWPWSNNQGLDSLDQLLTLKTHYSHRVLFINR